MLVLYIFILMFTNSINHLKKNIHSTFINRITIITLFICIFYTFNTLYFQTIGKGISLYSGLYQTTVQSNIIEILLIIVGICILFGWPSIKNPLATVTLSPATSTDSSRSLAKEAVKTTSCSSCSANLGPIAAAEQEKNKNIGLGYGPNTLALHLNPVQGINLSNSKEEEGLLASRQKGVDLEAGSAGLYLIKTDQYSLIALFSILGGSLLMSSLDLLSMYLSIELQSFALYILATLNKERLSATNAGLKYFLLGSLSSCFILLGSAIIYSYTGLTQFEAINTLMSCISPSSVGLLSTEAFVPFVDQVDALSLSACNGYTEHGTLQEAGRAYADLSKAFPVEGANGPCAKREGGVQLFFNNINKAFYIGFIIIIIGFLFKISAAPFYQWAPDVYDGTPTIVTVWLTIVVKLTILVFLLGLLDLCITDNKFINISLQALAHSTGENFALGSLQIKNLLLISSVLSLLIGTIVGLKQIKVKRLLAFSSISHVGFLLLALGIYTQKSVDSFIFYLVQYSVTSLNIFLILLAFGYLLNNYKYSNKHYAADPSSYLLHSTKELQPFGSFSTNALDKAEEDINFLIELKGQIYKNPVLSISLAICLFSMAGIPPLIGFFSKQFVLFSSIENGYNFLSIVAILVSVISASYYLRLIKITFFEEAVSLRTLTLSDKGTDPKSGSFSTFGIFGSKRPSTEAKTNVSLYSNNLKCAQLNLTNVHSYILAILTLLILFFFLDPSILLNGTQLISLTIFNI